MKVKTSITLSEELLKVLDKRARQHHKNRSDFIEAAVWAFIRQLARNEQNAHDLDILCRRSKYGDSIRPCALRSTFRSNYQLPTLAPHTPRIARGAYASAGVTNYRLSASC